MDWYTFFYTINDFLWSLNDKRFTDVVFNGEEVDRNNNGKVKLTIKNNFINSKTYSLITLLNGNFLKDSLNISVNAVDTSSLIIGLTKGNPGCHMLFITKSATDSGILRELLASALVLGS